MALREALYGLVVHNYTDVYQHVSVYRARERTHLIQVLVGPSDDTHPGKYIYEVGACGPLLFESRADACVKMELGVGCELTWAKLES